MMREPRHPWHRFTAVLLAVLLLHTTWLSAAAWCDAPVTGRSARATVATHVAHHGGHESLPPSPGVPSPDVPSPSPDGALPCPMAMTCTLTLALTALPSVSARVRLIPTLPPATTPPALRSWLFSPEPPPPRG